MSKPFKEWTIKETSEWVKGLFLDEEDEPEVPAKIFKDNKIVGRILFKLDVETLGAMGIQEYGVRLRIHLAIQELMETEASYTPPKRYLHPLIGSSRPTQSEHPDYNVAQTNMPTTEKDAYRGLYSPQRFAVHDDSEDIGSDEISESSFDSHVKPNTRYLTKEQVEEAVKTEVEKMAISWNEKQLPLLEAKSYRLYSARGSAFQKKSELELLEKRMRKFQGSIIRSAPLTLGEVKVMSRGLEVSLQSQLKLQWLLELYNGPKPPLPAAKPAPTAVKPRTRTLKSAEDNESMDDFIEYDDEEQPGLRALLDDGFDLRHQRAEESEPEATVTFKSSFTRIAYKGQFGLNWQNILDILQRFDPSAILKKVKGLIARRAVSPEASMTIEDSCLIYIWEEFFLHYQNKAKSSAFKRGMPDPKLFAEFCTLASIQPAKAESKAQHKVNKMIPPEESVKTALSIQQDDRSKESNILPLNLDNPDFMQHEEIMISHDISLPVFCTFLKPHQIEGVRFLWKNLVDKNNGCILAHSMGLGKTLQVIVFICALIQTSRTEPDSLPHQLKDPSILILCPISVRANWQLEFKKWIPPNYLVDFSISVIGESGLDRLYQKALEIRRWFSTGGVLIMNYDTWRILSETGELMEDEDPGPSLQECLLDPGPSLVICDEGHIIKNPSSKISTLVKRIATPSKICLTGYPIQNNLMEYWCMVDFVYPGYLGPEATFEEYFCKPITDALYFNCNALTQQVAQLRLYILSVVLENIVARKDKAILTQGLPHKVEIIISCKLSPLQESLYKELITWFTDAYHVKEMSFFGKGHVLSDICNHPLTLKVSLIIDPSLHCQARINKRPNDMSAEDVTNEGGVTLNELATNINESTLKKILKSYNLEHYSIQDVSIGSKFKVLITIMKETVKLKEKMLVFTRSLALLDLIDNYIQCNPDFGFNHFRLDGSVSAQDRQAMLEAFNSSTSHNIFAISTMAGSLGINLVSASRVVLYDVDWNPSHSDQAIARLFRYGQDKETFVYRLYTHSTFEESLLKCSAVKSALFSRVVDQIDAPNNHTKLHKRYFKNPEPAPPFEGPPDISDEVAIAVAKACENELVTMELLDRDYDVIEFGLSEEVKAKARNSILIGQHMDTIQSPLLNSPPSLYTQSEKDTGEAASEVICISPLKRHKSRGTTPIQVETSPECAVSPRVTQVTPTEEQTSNHEDEPTISSLPASVEKPTSATTVSAPEGSIHGPSPRRCQSLPEAYIISSSDDDCGNPKKKPTLKPIGACVRRALVPPRDQPTMDPNVKSHRIPQVAKGIRSPKFEAAVILNGYTSSHQPSEAISSIKLLKEVQPLTSGIGYVKRQVQASQKSAIGEINAKSHTPTEGLGTGPKRPAPLSQTKESFRQLAAEALYHPTAHAFNLPNKFPGKRPLQSRSYPDRPPYEPGNKLPYHPTCSHHNSSHWKYASTSNTVGNNRQGKAPYISNAPKKNFRELHTSNLGVSEHAIHMGAASGPRGSNKQSNKKNKANASKKTKRKQTNQGSRNPSNGNHNQAFTFVGARKITQERVNPNSQRSESFIRRSISEQASHDSHNSKNGSHNEAVTLVGTSKSQEGADPYLQKPESFVRKSIPEQDIHSSYNARNGSHKVASSLPSTSEGQEGADLYLQKPDSL